MKIGILAAVPTNAGGVYQYTQSLLESLLKYSRFNYLIFKSGEGEASELNINSPHQAFAIALEPSNIFLKLKKVIYISFPLTRSYIEVGSNYRFMEQHNPNLIICPIISFIPLFINKPYIVTIHDLQHKYYPQFFSLKERLRRDYFYKNLAKNALLVVCESNFVKKDIVRFLHVAEEKIQVISSPPPPAHRTENLPAETLAAVRHKYSLPDKFIFYPAHFWYHKNHIRLVRAIKFLSNKYREEISLILVGLPKDNYDNARRMIEELGLENQVKWLGYVPEEDIPALYKLATALVMPTLFESLSMPIWEAFFLGCPVAASMVCALPEQVDDAALLFDPNHTEDMAEKIYRLWTDKDLRQRLIQKGYDRIKDLTLENYARRWDEVIAQALLRVES